MQRNYSLLYGLVGLVIGGLLTYGLIKPGVRTEEMQVETKERLVTSQKHGIEMGSSMDEMTASLRGRSSDEFDKAFLVAMIVHHQGAIEMAQAALQDGKHEELKELAGNIISAQNKEIEQMQQWQKQWGYTQGE